MRFDGILTTWDERQNLGFIAADQGGQDIVVPGSALRDGTRPKPGQRVSFEIDLNAAGGKVARNVAAVPPRGSALRRRLRQRRDGVGAVGLLAVPAFMLAFLVAAVAWRVDPAVAAAYVLVSLLTAVTFAADKVSANHDGPRTAGRTLLLMSLAGGWPGALVAMHLLQHKTAKAGFQSLFWCAVAANVTAFFWLVSPTDAGSLR